MGKMLDFLLVIPSMNENKYIKEIVAPLERILESRYSNYRIVIVDASRDEGVKTLLRSIGKNNKRVDIVLERRPHGKGADIMYGFSMYDASRYCFIDADLKPSLEYLRQMLGEEFDGCDCIAGSRYADMGLVRRPRLRLYVSLAYNRMINLLFDERIRDHQCGMKLFSRRAFKQIERLSEEKHFAWDTEVLLICARKNLKICEMPVGWVERRSKHTNMSRLIGDTAIFVPAILRLFYRFRLKKDLD